LSAFDLTKARGLNKARKAHPVRFFHLLATADRAALQMQHEDAGVPSLPGAKA
jgi:hypothetical protein